MRHHLITSILLAAGCAQDRGACWGGDGWIPTPAWYLDGAGDVDGDGLDDLLVGAPDADFGDFEAGAAYLVYGARF